jgi:transcriptional regulator PpsR
VLDCNPAATAVLGRSRADLVGSQLAEHISSPAEGTLIEALSTHATTGRSGSVPANGKHAEAPISIRPTLFRTAGEQLLLCRLEKASGDAPKANEITHQLESLFETGPDAIVFVTQNDVILSANEAFLRLTNVAQAIALKDRQITDFMGRGTVDMNVMRENAARTGSMRIYATRVVGEHGTEVPVEISTTYINTGKQPVLALVLRDASRAETVRNAGGQITDVDMRSVVELIGSNTLKGIVAKTTDVIEKMCIETAVELTSNNRVAAAEMLGLSRQSFYVKLRKYNLLKKEK